MKKTNLKKISVALVSVTSLCLMIILALAACSTYSAAPSPASPAGGTSTPPTTSTGAGEITIDLKAQNMAFDKNKITIPAGARVTINFNNQDSGMPHNFSAYTDSSATNVIFKGNIITGPATATYTFSAPATAGNYFFRCDPHPNIMKGQFIVQ
jgi:plastocyanin